MDRKHNIHAYTQEEFEDTKGVIRIHKSKERRHNGQNNTSIVISNHLIELKKKENQQIPHTQNPIENS